MKKKIFYVVDINDKYQVIIFKTCDVRLNEWLYDFYLTNGSEFEYQFCLLCKVVKLSELESLAKMVYDNGNMYIPTYWSED